MTAPGQHQTTSETNGKLWGEQAEDWANIQEGQCRPVYEAVLTRILTRANLSPTTHYLDAGCGAGMALEIAASQGAQVSGLDAAPALLAIARTRVPQADLHQGELETLPFPDHTFDLITGFNSFQYAANPAAALSDAKRVARPGATVVIMTWGDPANMPAAQLVAALKPLLPPPPPGAPGPFALSDKTALTSFATSAGLQPLDFLDVESPWHYSDLDTALRGLNSSGVAAKARLHSGHAAVDQAHAAALAPFAQPDGSYRIGATFRCLFTQA
jgi:SAM-dependent methyltransferase